MNLGLVGPLEVWGPGAVAHIGCLVIQAWILCVFSPLIKSLSPLSEFLQPMDGIRKDTFSE